MDDRFKNLNRRRHPGLAVFLLVLVCGLMLVSNRFVYTLIGFPASKFYQYLSYSVVGVVLAEIPLLAVWAVMSSQSLFRRLQFLFFSSVMLLAAWLLGFVSRMDLDTGINWANRESIYFLGWLPLMFLATSLPLIVLRFFFSRVLAPMDEVALPTRQPVTITGLMIATAVVALVLAATQAPGLIGMNQSEIWMTSGIFAGTLFLASLLIVLPSVLILCSPRRNVWVWLPIVFCGSFSPVVGTWAVFVIYNRASFRDILVPVQGFASTMALFLIGIVIIRQYGYRLKKSTRAN